MAAAVPIRPLEDILDEVMHLESSMEIVFVNDTRVMCDGDEGPLGHPKVFYTIGEKGYAECLYCDRVYVYDPARAGTVLEGGFKNVRADETLTLSGRDAPLQLASRALADDTGAS